VYGASYYPLFRIYGQDWGRTWQRLAYGHGRTIAYRYSDRFPSSTSSPWWSWPLVGRPLWFYRETIQPDKQRGVLSLGSPWIWWTFLVPGLPLVVLGLRQRPEARRPVAFCLIAYASQWLPWSLSPGFPYYMLASLPWMTLLLGFGLAEWARRGKSGRPGVAVYLLLAGLVLWAYLPVWTAQEIPRSEVGNLLFLPYWR
jgi:dolichyl-phosphate-mannose--protein O-mannosyl transferase